MVKYLAYTLLGVMFLTGTYLVLRFGSLPGKIAKRRGHPKATRIGIIGWGGVFTLGLLWILAMVLAFLPFDKSAKDELKTLRSVKNHPLKIVLNTLVVLLFVFSFTIVMGFVLPPQKTIDANYLSEAPYKEAQIVGTIENPILIETSGIARSHREDNHIWLHNDSNNEELIFAMGLEGEDYGAFKVNGVTMRDWEDIASYEQEGTPYLLIADVGDNLSERSIYELHAVVEPEVMPGQTSSPVEVAWTLSFQYEDGPRDCEAVAVDIERGEILLISKRDVPQRVYSLPLPKDRSEISEEPAVARFVTEVPTIPQPTLIDTISHYPKGINKGMVTSFDISDDGQSALVLTYDNVYKFERAVDEDWSNAFKRIPERKRVPVRSEAVGFLAESETFFVIPEHQGSPLYRFESLDTTSE